MAEWHMSEELAAELLAQLDTAAKAAALWRGAGTAGAPMGLGLLEWDGGTGGGAPPGWEADPSEPSGPPGWGGNSVRRTAAGWELVPGRAAPLFGWPEGAAASGGTGPAEISRFFERDARRYG